MSTIWSKFSPPAHPDWILDACSSLSRTAALYAKRTIPGSIQTPMIVVPVKRILRGVYGSDLKAASALMIQALAAVPYNASVAICCWWNFKVLRHKPLTEEEMMKLWDEEDDL